MFSKIKRAQLEKGDGTVSTFFRISMPFTNGVVSKPLKGVRKPRKMELKKVDSA